MLCFVHVRNASIKNLRWKGKGSLIGERVGYAHGGKVIPQLFFSDTGAYRLAVCEFLF